MFVPRFVFYSAKLLPAELVLTPAVSAHAVAAFSEKAANKLILQLLFVECNVPDVTVIMKTTKK